MKYNFGLLIVAAILALISSVVGRPLEGLTDALNMGLDGVVDQGLGLVNAGLGGLGADPGTLLIG